MKLYHWSTNIVTEPRIHGNCGYGFYLAKDKKYSRVAGDMLHKVIVQPQNTCVFNDAEVRNHAFFNIDKKHYEEYLAQGYDSLAWFKNGKLAEFVVLKPEVIKDIEFIGSRLDEEVSINDKTFVPNEQWMSEKYDELNAALFNGRLMECKFGIFTTGIGSFGDVLGRFKITGRRIIIDRRTMRMYQDNYYNREYIDKNNFVDICMPKIELNGNYSGTEHGFLCTLVHEMCHYYTYMYGWVPKKAHGTEFKEIGQIVSARSNGLFTIQTLASAEQLSELELDAKIQASNEKRVNKRKQGTYAVVEFYNNGTIRLILTKSNELIKRIQKINSSHGGTCIITDNPDIINFLFSKGCDSLSREYYYYTIQKEPWINELKEMLNGESKKDDDIEVQQHSESEQKKTFVVHTTKGEFKCDFNSEEELKNKIKERFPKMSDETINKVISNPSNYVNERKKVMKDIINEVIDEFIENESMKNMEMEGDVEITPDMNLGIYSPFQL